METTPTTKKVQTIFEEAQKIRESELAEEIDLGWHGTAQRSLERETEEKVEPVKEAETESRPVNLEDKKLDAKAKPEPSKAKGLQETTISSGLLNINSEFAAKIV